MTLDIGTTLDVTVPGIARQFGVAHSRNARLGRVIEVYKEFADRTNGYLHTPVFERLRDGENDAAVKRFFASPFADVRIWLPEMFGIYVTRFPDHPLTYIVVDNLSDEYGKYFGNDEQQPSHALLYRRVLDELGVAVREDTMTTPAKQTSKAAAAYYDWFREQVETEAPEYLIGHFLAYEITDVLDFPDYTIAAKRIWRDKPGVHEFFSQHADSGHDAAFARDLEPFFEENRKPVIAAMGELLEQWTKFYRAASAEVKA